MTQGLGRDVRIAARRLLATPLFTSFAVLSLAVGIGVTAVAYSIVESIFFKELGIRDPNTAAFVTAPDYGRQRFRSALSRLDFDELRASQACFRTLGASWTFHPSVTGPAKTELMQGEAVSGDYFQTLGVTAAIGRLIEPRDDEPSAAVVVLSYALWRRGFASDPRIVGQSVRIGGQPFDIIGIAPKSFTGLIVAHGMDGTAVWVPLGTAPFFAPRFRWFASPAAPAATAQPDRDRRQLYVVGRLQPGRSIESASTEVANIATGLDLSHPRTVRDTMSGSSAKRGWAARTVAAVHTEEADYVRRVGIVVAGLVLLVVVVACTNLANLMLARGTTRRQEFAVRRALGAPRWRLVREQCAESLLIVLAGGLTAYVVMRILTAVSSVELPMAPGWTMSIAPSADRPTLVLAAVALLLSLLVFGLEPAVQLTRSKDVRGELAASAGSVGPPSVKRQRMLLRWQVAVSTGFFIIASMCVRYVFVELRHNSGVQTERLGIARVNFYAQGWDEARARRALQRVLEEARRQRGIASAAISTGLPFGTNVPYVRLTTPDQPLVPKDKQVVAKLVASTPDIFRTIGVSILRGRGFDDRDDAGAPTVAVVTDAAARALFGTSDVVGRQILAQVTSRGPHQPVKAVTIAGVAADTDTIYLSPRRGPVVYMPLAQHFDPFITVVVRASADSAAAVGAVQTAIRSADPDLAIEMAGSGPAILTGGYVFLRLVGVASLSLALLTLLLAMVGLYGVQLQGVTHRTREIGVRMSFGATAAQIRRMVLKDGYVPVVQGLAIGVFIGLSGRGIIRAYLDAKVSILDPWMLAIVPIPIILAAFCACYLPAHRAARVDPIVALRHL
jgi:predicted permease